MVGGESPSPDFVDLFCMKHTSANNYRKDQMKAKTTKRSKPRLPRVVSSEVSTVLMKMSQVHTRLDEILNRLELLREQCRSLEGPTTEQYSRDRAVILAENHKLSKLHGDLRKIMADNGKVAF